MSLTTRAHAEHSDRPGLGSDTTPPGRSTRKRGPVVSPKLENAKRRIQRAHDTLEEGDLLIAARHWPVTNAGNKRAPLMA